MLMATTSVMLKMTALPKEAKEMRSFHCECMQIARFGRSLLTVEDDDGEGGDMPAKDFTHKEEGGQEAAPVEMNATTAKMVAELRLELDQHGVKVERIGLLCYKTLVCAAASRNVNFVVAALLIICFFWQRVMRVVSIAAADV
eukprot:138065-Pleurochrysis_carterae.AAC.1